MPIHSILWHSSTLCICRYMLHDQSSSQIHTITQYKLQGQSLVKPSQSLVQSLVRKNAAFGGLVGNEVVIFCPGAIWKNCIFSCGPPNSGSWVEWKWCHNVMVEADIHLRLLHTSILDIYKVFELLLCCLKAIWLHPYTVTPAKLAQDLGIQGNVLSENKAITSWLRLISTSDCFIHPY